MNKEIWKDIHNFNHYEISSLGRVRNKNTQLILKQYLDKYGYPFVSLSDSAKRGSKNRHKKETIHRLVAVAFIDNPLNKPEVNHIDANKSNYNINNLEWVTKKENSQHAYKKGLYKIATHEELVKMAHNNKRNKCVAKLDMGDNILEEFQSLTQAALSVNGNGQCVGKCCVGKLKTYKGFKWKYKK